MKELSGNAADRVAASPEQAFGFLAAVDRYPVWYPDVVSGVQVLGRDDRGHPTAVRAQLRVAYGPLAHDLDLVLAVTLEQPRAVMLARIGGSQRFDLTWHVHDDAPTRIALDLYAKLRLPRFVPLEGVGNTMATQFVAAAKAALASGT